MRPFKVVGSRSRENWILTLVSCGDVRLVGGRRAEQHFRRDERWRDVDLLGARLGLRRGFGELIGDDRHQAALPLYGPAHLDPALGVETRRHVEAEAASLRLLAGDPDSGIRRADDEITAGRCRRAAPAANHHRDSGRGTVPSP